MATVEELMKSQNAASTDGAPSGTLNTPTKVETTTPSNGYTPTGYSSDINSMFEAQKNATLANLQNSYNQSLSAAQEARDKIAPQYQQSANDLGVQYERNRRNANMQAAANGLNTGTASQMALAQNSAYQRDFGNLRASEGEALAAADRGIADLTAQDQNDIAAAIADNDYKRAAALLDEKNAAYSRDMAKAETLASYGDFSMYATMYGEEAAENMYNTWLTQNPDLAYTLGKITKQERDNLKRGRPKDYVGAGGGSGSGAKDMTGFGAGVPIDVSVSKYPDLYQSLLEGAI
jgi:hypothetical protein